MWHTRPSSWVLVTCLVAVMTSHTARADKCTEAPAETVGTCSACATSPLQVDMDLCCEDSRVLDLCRNLPRLLNEEPQEGVWAEDYYRSGPYGEGYVEDELDDDDKRARPFLGKRTRPFLGKRPEDKRARPFLGKKANSFMAKRAEDAELDAFLKRARPFLGKKARPFLGKREDEAEDLADMLKRARPFLGKKARPFLGKRDDESDGFSDMLKRARPFLGKKAHSFAG